MSKLEDDQNLLSKKGQNDFDDGVPAEVRKVSVKSDDEDCLRPPEKLNVCQWVIVAILYLILAFLVGFIIYISATWNQDRTNEYT